VTSRRARPSLALAALLSLAVHGGVLAACLTPRHSRTPATAPASFSVVLVSAVPGPAVAAEEATAQASLTVAKPDREEPASAPRVPEAHPAVPDKLAVETPALLPSPVAKPKDKPRKAAAIIATATPQPSATLALAAPPSSSAPAETPSASAEDPIAPESASGKAAGNTTGEGAVASAPSARSSDRNYLAEIMASLARHKRYPEVARRQEEQGTVLIAFAVDRAGRLLSFDIRKGSGNAALDRAAEEMVRRADPLPPAPASYAGTRLDLVLPVTFSLQR
jgi:protein TonB